MTYATLFDGFLIIGGTIAFWRWVGRPLAEWLDTSSFRGVKVVPPPEVDPVEEVARDA